MLNWANWYVQEVTTGETSYGAPTATATIGMDINPKYAFPSFVPTVDFMNDLNERLSNKPKIPVSSCYGDFERLFCGHFHVPSVNVDKVIFNNPATIIMWNDGSKTVVKCQSGDVYDPEKGFVMAYLKKLLGNDNTFNKEINKWVTVDNVHDIPINRPLTTEELMEMSGKKVWCSSIDGSGNESFTNRWCGWHTIKNKRLYDNRHSSYSIYDNGTLYGFKAYLTEQK